MEFKKPQVNGDWTAQGSLMNLAKQQGCTKVKVANRGKGDFYLLIKDNGEYATGPVGKKSQGLTPEQLNVSTNKDGLFVAHREGNGTDERTALVK